MGTPRRDCNVGRGVESQRSSPVWRSIPGVKAAQFGGVSRVSRVSPGLTRRSPDIAPERWSSSRGPSASPPLQPPWVLSMPLAWSPSSTSQLSWSSQIQQFQLRVTNQQIHREWKKTIGDGYGSWSSQCLMSSSSYWEDIVYPQGYCDFLKFPFRTSFQSLLPCGRTANFYF